MIEGGGERERIRKRDLIERGGDSWRERERGRIAERGREK